MTTMTPADATRKPGTSVEQNVANMLPQYTMGAFNTFETGMSFLNTPGGMPGSMQSGMPPATSAGDWLDLGSSDLNNDPLLNMFMAGNPEYGGMSFDNALHNSAGTSRMNPLKQQGSGTVAPGSLDLSGLQSFEDYAADALGGAGQGANTSAGITPGFGGDFSEWVHSQQWSNEEGEAQTQG
jgi:hypothetical protein